MCFFCKNNCLLLILHRSEPQLFIMVIPVLEDNHIDTVHLIGRHLSLHQSDANIQGSLVNNMSRYL